MRYTSIRSHSPLTVLAQCLCGLSLLAPLTVASQTAFPTNVNPTCVVPSATFASWFQSNSPSSGGLVTPADSINFAPNSRCSFYQWSDRMFLWLTSPLSNSLVLNSPTFFNIASGSGSSLAYVPNGSNIGATQSLFRVRSAKLGANRLHVMKDTNGHLREILPAPTGSSGKSLIQNSAGKMVEIGKVAIGKGGKPTFFDASGKPVSLPKKFAFNTSIASRVAPHLNNLTSANRGGFVQGFRTGTGNQVVFLDQNGTVVPTQGQAGGNAVLIGLNQNTPADLAPVYYATLVNDMFAYFQSNPANNAPNTTFPTSQADANAIVSFAKQAYGATINDVNALAMEIKSSWVDASTLANPGQYITVTAPVPTYNQSNPNMWVPNGNKSATLALVGMHVVGSANGHPEMIWATFEHISNSPNAGYSYMNNAPTPTPVPVPQSNSGTWVFSNNTAPYNVELATVQVPTPTPTPTPAAGTIFSNTSAAIAPSNTLRTAPWGSSSVPYFQFGTTSANNPTAAVLNSEILSINNSVRGQLSSGDVRANYMLVGAIWGGIGSLAPLPLNQAGTLALANSTMETYHQLPTTPPSPTPTPATNCFTCHSSNGTVTIQVPLGPPVVIPITNTSVSHIYPNLTPLPTPTSAPTAKQ